MQISILQTKQFLNSFFTLKEQRVSTKLLLSLIIVAYIFGVGVRLVWAFQNHGVEAFKFNNEFIINSPDGFYFAEGARDILAGGHELNDHSPVDRAISILTAILYKIIPFISFETLIFYMPAFIAPLIVVPMILIGKELKNVLFGFYASIIALFSFGFYARTFVGYYDDDLLTLVLPILLVYTLMLHSRRDDFKSLLFVAVTAVFYDWWYTNAAIIISATAVCLAIYSFFFDKKNLANYKALSLLLIIASQISVAVELGLSLLLILLFVGKKESSRHYIYGLLLASFVLFAYYGGMDPLIAKWNYYIFKPIAQEDASIGLKYFSSLKTVTESQYASFESIVKYTTGNVYFFWAGLIGVIVLMLRYRLFILLLPIFGLGILSIDGGLRFTGYGATAFAFGISYLLVIFTQLLPLLPASIVAQIAVLFASVYPNINLIATTKVIPAMVKDEVALLANFGKRAGREDYVYSWWDYGYPVRYYANVKTHSDVGSQEGHLTFIESSVLTSTSQMYAANTLRDSTELHEFRMQNKISSTGGTFGDIMKYNRYKPSYDPMQMQFYLGAFDYPVYPKTRDVYLMLPYRMLSIFSTIAMFSQRDLKTGKKVKQNLFYYSDQFTEDSNTIKMPEVIFDKMSGLVYIQNKPLKIASFIVVSESMNDRPQITNVPLYKDSSVALVYMKDYRTFLLCDAEMLSSNFIQMFVFNNYNRDIFERVEANPYLKIFKLKK